MTVSLTEAQFQQQVTDLADRLGWLWLHVDKMGNPQNQWRTPTRGPLRNFPDLMMVRKSTLLFAELKAQGKAATDAQRDCLKVLGGVTPHTYIWRPSDFPQIVEVLSNA